MFPLSQLVVIQAGFSAKIFELTNLIDRDWMRAFIAGLQIPNCVSIVNY